MPISDAAARNALPRDKPYKLFDGGGLYLLIDPTGAKYWRRNYQVAGRQKTAAIGVYWSRKAAQEPVDTTRRKATMSLAAARVAAEEHRRLIRLGHDPVAQRMATAAADREARTAAIEARRAAKAAEAERKRVAKEQRAADRRTFRRVADEWMEACESGWTADHAKQVRQSLRDHVEPALGSKPIAEIGTDEIDRVLGAMLADNKIETARRVKQRLAAIWEFAVLRRYSERDPVTPIGRRFRASQKQALKRKPRRHFAAVPPADVPQLLRAMRSYVGEEVTRTAMWALALTFVRTSELRHADEAEFDLDAAAPTWVVPVERMKIKLRGDEAAEPHIVPLSRQAVDILRPLKKHAQRRRASGLPGFMFPKTRDPRRVLSENAVLSALAAIGFGGRQTGHGFRAIASTLLHEANWPDGAIEAQLAHEKSDIVAAAYDRSTHLDTRRRMMQAYADMLDRIEKEPAGTSNVVRIRAA